MTLAGDLDFLRGLADRRGEVLVAGLPGLRAPARANLVRLRRRPIELAGELTLEVDAGTELAVILAEMQARDRHLQTMTIAAHDTSVELRDLLIAGIDGRGRDGTISVNLDFPSRP